MTKTYYVSIDSESRVVQSVVFEVDHGPSVEVDGVSFYRVDGAKPHRGGVFVDGSVVPPGDPPPEIIPEGI